MFFLTLTVQILLTYKNYDLPCCQLGYKEDIYTPKITMICYFVINQLGLKGTTDDTLLEISILPQNLFHCHRFCVIPQQIFI